MFVSFPLRFLTGLLRSPYDRFMYDFSPKIIIKKTCNNRTIFAKSAYDVSYDVSTGYGPRGALM